MTMNRTKMAFIVGAVIALGGLALRFSAHALATTWESLGPNAWGGTTEPATERTYQISGLMLFVRALSFCRWRSIPGCLPNTPHLGDGLNPRSRLPPWWKEG